MEKVRITIDGKEYEVQKGKTVLQAALENGIAIPYFCYHPRLKIIGACRMCIVYNEKTGRLITSCNTPVEDGMVISTKHDLVKANQKYLLQAFMTRHPLDCPICDKAGECDLQNYGAIFGPQRQIVPVSALEKERHYVDWESDFLEYYSNRCVVCYRCTRACDDVVGAHALYIEERGFQSNIAPAVRPMDTSSCEMCGICVHVCPVGAIISKPFKYWTRSWLLERASTHCFNCAVGCEVQVEFGLGDWRSQRKVYRTKPTDELNICAKTFFGYDVLNENRLLSCYLHGKEESPSNVASFLANILKERGESTAIVVSPYLSNEVLQSIRSVAEAVGSFITSTLSLDLYPFLEAFGEPKDVSVHDLSSYEGFVLIGEDITSSLPVLSYYIKGKVYRVGEFSRDSKLRPHVIDLESLKDLEGKFLVLVNTTGLIGDKARALGEYLKSLKDRVDFMVLHKDANFKGVYRIFGDKLSHLGGLLEEVQRGNIKNLVVFGEDILDYYPEEYVYGLFEKLEHLVVFSPFADGLSSYAGIRIPMNLLGEVEGTFSSLFGDVPSRRILPWAFNDRDFFQALTSAVGSLNKGIKILKKESYQPVKTPEVHLYRSSWITRRSQNLSKLYEKNSTVLQRWT